MKEVIKVIMLVNTTYGGRRLHIDNEVDVPVEVGQRWAERKIAKLVSDEETQIKIDFPENVNTENLASYTAKQLYAICVQKGIEAAPRMSKAEYIALLSKEA